MAQHGTRDARETDAHGAPRYANFWETGTGQRCITLLERHLPMYSLGRTHLDLGMHREVSIPPSQRSTARQYGVPLASPSRNAREPSAKSPLQGRHHLNSKDNAPSL